MGDTLVLVRRPSFPAWVDQHVTNVLVNSSKAGASISAVFTTLNLVARLYRAQLMVKWLRAVNTRGGNSVESGAIATGVGAVVHVSLTASPRDGDGVAGSA